MGSTIRVLNNVVAEYQARYAKPVLSLVMNRADTVEAIFDALLPFNFQLQNMDVFTEGNITAQKIGFRLPERNINFQFSAEFCTFVKQGATWRTAEEDLAVLEAAEGALLRSKNIEVAARSVTISMHLQLLDTHLHDVMAPFLPAAFLSSKDPRLDDEYKPNRHAVLANWQNGAVLLDKSNVAANAIYVRLTTESNGSIRQLFEKLYRDEMYVFSVLNVQEENPDE